MENELHQALRLMAWERAKSELMSILAAYKGYIELHEMRDTIDTFINTVENEGLLE